ncbi:transcription factor bHLH96-like isoform X2 [Cucurbita moschata]|uniref:Transcription factor bHLH96-like isoform X2 n=1 Tax=Cucurbita moschata TaxID=3662 RepID=A0A6J1GKG5_CUCMO|nr:transcription factor bHLH96-like isoform X2 [Cucurbita moschata]
MMALETVVYPQNRDTFTYVGRDFCSYGGAWPGYDYGFQLEQEKSFLENPQKLPTNWEPSPEECSINQPLSVGALYPPMEVEQSPPSPPSPPPTTGRRKRRRTRNMKNKEEIENQRMTHIAVERNRRKQMNEYLAVLRSLMPCSYVQRGDQASIIGGAINFVKELEQQLQFIKAHKEPTASSPFADFFSFPQFSTPATNSTHDSASSNTQWAAGDIEVTMVDTHANLKILSKKRPRQLLKMVAGFQSLRFSVLHLNVTTLDQMVLYSVSIKIEEGCELNTVDEIAAAVNQILLSIQEESAFS